MGTNLTDGNIDRMGAVRFTFDPASVAASMTAEQSVTVPGLALGDMVIVRKPTLSAGLAIGSARVSAANTLLVTLINASVGAIDPASESYTLLWFRPTPGATLPTGVLV